MTVICCDGSTWASTPSVVVNVVAASSGAVARNLRGGAADAVRGGDAAESPAGLLATTV